MLFFSESVLAIRHFILEYIFSRNKYDWFGWTISPMLELIFPISKPNCFHWISYFQSSFVHRITHSNKLSLFGLSKLLSHLLNILLFKPPAFFYISSCPIYAVFCNEVVLLDHIYSVFDTWGSDNFLLSVPYLRWCFKYRFVENWNLCQNEEVWHFAAKICMQSQ